jgi:Fuc2NAc and GlcNAc transferase
MWLMLSSVFWFDATLTLWRRFRNREQLSTPHRKHAYQRIVQSGFSHQKTVLLAAVTFIIIFLVPLLSFTVLESGVIETSGFEGIYGSTVDLPPSLLIQVV